jgi:hypothetical protein
MRTWSVRGCACAEWNWSASATAMAAMGKSFIGKGYEVRWLIKQRNRPSLSPSSIKISVSVCFLTTAVGSTSPRQNPHQPSGCPLTPDVDSSVGFRTDTVVWFLGLVIMVSVRFFGPKPVWIFRIGF